MAPAGDPDALTPDAVASRTFAFVKRGYDVREVRAFLDGVAAELGVLRDHVADLERRLADTQEHLEAARHLDEGQVAAKLGVETVRVIDAARTAAAETRSRAEEEAAGIVRRAEATAELARVEAEEEAARRLAAADEEVAERLQAAASALTDARQQAASLVEDGRLEGRAMVDEARAVRERMLRDLGRRRRDLRQQIDRLEAGQARLLAAFAVVGEVTTEVTAELEAALPAARAAVDGAEDAAAVADGDDHLDDDVVAAVEAHRAEQRAAGQAALDDDVRASIADAASVAADAPADDGPSAADGSSAADGPSDHVGADRRPDEVDRAEGVPDRSADGLDPRRAGGAVRANPVAAIVGDADGRPGLDVAPAVAALTEASVPDAAGPGVGAAPDDVLARCGAAVEEAERTLGRRLKRTLADEQNELLGAVAERTGPLEVALLLGDRAHQERRYADATLAPLAAAAAAGAEAARSAWPQLAVVGPRTRVGDLAEDLAAAVVGAVRHGVGGALADGDAHHDPEVRAEGVRDAYREVRLGRLDDLAAAAVAVAHQRGVLDALAPDVALRWARPVDHDPRSVCPVCGAEGAEAVAAAIAATRVTGPGCPSILVPVAVAADVA